MRLKVVRLMTGVILTSLLSGYFAGWADASQKILHIDAGESALLSYQGIQRVAVGNPEVIDARPLNSREILLTAKQPGNSTLVIWDRKGRHFQTLLIHPSTTARLWEIEKLLAEEGIKVSLTESATVLEGTVENPAAKARALAIAGAFGPNVVDLLEVARADQIRLEANVLELDRSTGRKLGLQNVERTKGGILTGFVDLATDFDHIGIHTLNDISGAENFSMIVNALEEKNLARVLSRPYLITLSAEQAILNVGGEIPVPVGLDSGEIKIDWKPYGVILSITPELDRNGSIWITLEAEVSEIDWDNRIVTSGIEIPALKTRKISNKVRLRPGEPLIVGGLIDNKQTELKTKIPLLGDLPIIGELFRSKRFENSETELVITIVPEIVNHGSGKQDLDRNSLPSQTSREITLGMPPTSSLGQSPSPVQIKQPTTPEYNSASGSSPTIWVVQVGALPDETSAEQRRAKLGRQGYNAWVTEAIVEGQRFFRVRVPAGENRTAALKLARELKKKGYRTFVTRERKLQ